MYELCNFQTHYIIYSIYRVFSVYIWYAPKQILVWVDTSGCNKLSCKMNAKLHRKVNMFKGYIFYFTEMIKNYYQNQNAE